MNISNYYWYFTSAIPPKLCDDIIKYGLSQAETMARTGGYGDRELTKEEIKDMKRKRNSDLVWLNDPWIYKELHPYIHQANRNAGWNFDWDRSESCQFTKYKLNQYYDWHCDDWNAPYQRRLDDPTNGKARKLSVTCSLSDPKDYKGGDLILYEDEKGVKIPREQGTLILFPSYVMHEVTKVSKGERNS